MFFNLSRFRLNTTPVDGQVFFRNIKDEIITQLKRATKEIKVALAWLTDEDLIRQLIQQTQAGIDVQIIISDSVENFRNTDKFREFFMLKGLLFVSTRPFMHHKFCIIDDQTIINGSYNWSYPARSNEENIVILHLDTGKKEDKLFLEKFLVKYKFLWQRCSTQVNTISELNRFKDQSQDHASILSDLDEKEIQLRNDFEKDVRTSIQKSKEANIYVSEYILERMKSDGGGVEFVKRILYDEITSGDMKSGFRRLEEHIPHRVDLSLEYLASRPRYASLFTEQEKEFCNNLMKKYAL